MTVQLCGAALYVQRMLFTYILHFDEETVNVVPGIAVVQVLLMPLYLLTDEVKDVVEVAEHFVVRARQVLHHTRQGLIELLERKQ